MRSLPGGSSFPPSSSTFLAGLSKFLLVDKRLRLSKGSGRRKPKRSRGQAGVRSRRAHGEDSPCEGCAYPGARGAAASGSGKLQVPTAIINIVINTCEWFYSKVFLHQTLIRRRLSLFSPPSSSVTEDYSFGLIAPGPGAGDSCRRCRSPRPGKRDRCIFWTSQPMHESSLNHGAEAAGAAGGIPWLGSDEPDGV